MLSGGRPFDKEVLMPQELLIEDYAVDVPAAMKPVVDELWNAADFKGSDFTKMVNGSGHTLSRILLRVRSLSWRRVVRGSFSPILFE